MNPQSTETTLSQLGFSNLVRQSWQVVKKNYWTIFKIALLGFLVVLTPALVTALLSNLFHNSDLAVAIAGFANLAARIVLFLIGMGWIYIMMKLVRGEGATFKDLFAKNKRVIQYFLASLLYGLVVFGGFVLLIIPGIIWSLKYSQMLYLVIDKDMGVMDAFRASSKMTKGSKATMMLYGFGFLGINLLGALLLGLGLFVTLPIAWLANGIIYQHLSKRLAA